MNPALLVILLIISLGVIGYLVYEKMEYDAKTCPACPVCPAPINCTPNLLIGQVRAYRKFHIYINDDTEPAFEFEPSFTAPDKFEMTDFSVELPNKEDLQKIKFSSSPFSFPDKNLYAYGQPLLPLKPGSYAISMFICTNKNCTVKTAPLVHPDTKRALSYGSSATAGDKKAFTEFTSGNIYHGGRSLVIYFD